MVRNVNPVSSLKRPIVMKLILGAILTGIILLVDLSEPYFDGFALYVFSLFPASMILGAIELYVITTGFVFLLYWARKFRAKYIVQVCIIVAFLLLNVLGDHFTNYEFLQLPF
jgi:hypothetical protein